MEFSQPDWIELASQATLFQMIRREYRTLTQAKVAFLIISDDPDRVLPGLVMARRLKENRGADVRVLFFGPAVKTAVSGPLDEAVQGLAEVGISAKACSTQVEHYELNRDYSARPIELLAAGAEVEAWATQGYTVLSF